MLGDLGKKGLEKRRRLKTVTQQLNNLKIINFIYQWIAKVDIDGRHHGFRR